MPLDLDDPRPTYLQIADRLRRAVAEGEYKQGEKLPAVRAIAKEYGTANATAAKALEVLRQEGIVIGRPGIGTVVRDPKAAAVPSVQSQVDELRETVDGLAARLGRLETHADQSKSGQSESP